MKDKIEYRKQYYIKNKEVMQQRSKARYFKKKAETPRKPCLICKRPLPPHKEKYCLDCVVIGRKNVDLQRRFGIVLSDYQEMHTKQQGVCAICSSVCSSGMSLAVDHDHSTGKVRGLLCRRCNQLLGQFNDNIELFQKSINYLERTK